LANRRVKQGLLLRGNIAKCVYVARGEREDPHHCPRKSKRKKSRDRFVSLSVGRVRGAVVSASVERG
jgi:hypothetical protein